MANVIWYIVGLVIGISAGLTVGLMKWGVRLDIIRRLTAPPTDAHEVWDRRDWQINEIAWFGTADAAEKELVAIRSFTPTPGAINALPDPLRQYIHDLETRCDPAGDVATLTLVRDQNVQLQARLDIAEAKVRRVEVLTNLWENSPSEADFPSGSNYRAAAVALHAASRLVLEVLSGD